MPNHSHIPAAPLPLNSAAAGAPQTPALRPTPPSGEGPAPSAPRPYPSQYVSRWTAKNGQEIVFRPIRPQDESMMVQFHQTLSDQSVYLRFFHMESLSARVAHERLIRKCFVDYDQEFALVAERLAPQSGFPEILAVGRLSKSPGTRRAEVSVLVSDRFQHQGLGRELVRRLIQVGRDENLQEIVANILPENSAMRALGARFGFQIQPGKDPSMVVAVLRLDSNSPAAATSAASPAPPVPNSDA